MKGFVAFLTVILFFFTACANNEARGGERVNAENYNGLAFADDEKIINEPLEIPVKPKETLPAETVSGEAAPSESASESPSEPPSESSGEPPGESPSEPPSEPPSESPSESPSEPPSETPSETPRSTTPEPVKTAPPDIENPPKIEVVASDYNALNYGEVVGVWISYIELSGILTGKSEAAFRRSYGEMMDNCVSIGINTVYVHLRPFGDALYKSGYYPWSKYVTGEVGVEPDFDPLKVMLEESHGRGVSFHGWLNPMRINSAADIEKVSRGYPVGEWYADPAKKGKYIVKSGDYWYLNPAYGEVIGLIGNGAAEITANYDVDGIHIDDYFYPVTDGAFDADAFGASSFALLNSFRLYNCNSMVKTLYSAVKKGNPSALFGVSPQGNIEHNYNELYADVEKWCKSAGFADYVAPQIYYGFEHSSLPYVSCINQWQEMLNGSGVKLITGLAVYKIGKTDGWAGAGSDEWLNSKQILKRQIEVAKGMKSYGGVVFYSYNYLFNPEHLSPLHTAEIEALKTAING
ncbi:MAG: family 10 glycosylhydrolase [Oscillospiraceae bacterium]|jgi:uncharacterized lipoprotein YddW (UPF0748 family)|nr:family 10 glycosylhydrolase [Oscillospiraceae bacterium]